MSSLRDFVLPLVLRDARGRVQAPSADAFAAVGRGVESVVLARAVRSHVARRVRGHGRKTVVFP